MGKETTTIGLTAGQRQGVAAILNGLLADEYVLYTKTRNFHWNVTGPHFSDLHKFFEAQYDEIDDLIDVIAERVRALGETPLGSLREFLAETRLKEAKGAHTASEMIAALASDHEAIIRQMRKDLEAAKDKFGDAGNQDAITGWMEQHEKMAWMLRSTLG
jgi:starvation-inducible DNA-binding protein